MVYERLQDDGRPAQATPVRLNHGPASCEPTTAEGSLEFHGPGVPRRHRADVGWSRP